jgi:hypothetical protein
MSLDSKQKKALLGVGVALCLLVLTSELVKAYDKYIPPYREGKCFELEGTPVGPIKFQVVENNMSGSYTVAVGTIKNPFGLEGVTIQVPVKAGFQDLRQSQTKGVSCE